MPLHLFSNGHGQMQDDYGNMQFLSHNAWRNAWILWYYEDFTYELE